MRRTSRRRAEPGPRRRLLEAGRRLFARHGYDGTTVRDLALNAEVNLSAIGYHFTNKRGLYSAVLMELVGPIGVRMDWVARAPVPPLDKIDRAVQTIFEHIAQNPEMPALIVREMASGSAVAGEITTAMSRALGALTRIINEGQEDGSIRQGDPLLLALSTVAQPVYLNLARPALAAATGLDQADPTTRERVVAHAVEMVLAALRSQAPAAPPPPPAA